MLFLNHSASRNGASILLLHLLQWLREHSDLYLEVLSNGGGPLIDEFRAVAPTRVWRNPVSLLGPTSHRWSRLFGPNIEGYLLGLFLGRRDYDLVYANTAATWNHVAALSKCHSTLLWHIHELSYALQLTVGKERARRLFPLVSRFVAVSGSVLEVLTSEFAVPRERVDLVHGFVPLRELPPAERHSRRQRILGSLGWPEDAFVVGGCGGLGWRKGTDLFLQIAHLVSRDATEGSVRFLWVGGSDGVESEALQFAYEVQALGLQQISRRVPSTVDVLDYYCAMDVFALTSREDPFPLVMLEAGMQGLPIVCFASTGGGPEFVATEGGIVVPYLDLNGFAVSLKALRTSFELRRRLGERARCKVKMNHCIDTQGPKLLRSIERCLAPKYV